MLFKPGSIFTLRAFQQKVRNRIHSILMKITGDRKRKKIAILLHSQLSTFDYEPHELLMLNQSMAATCFLKLQATEHDWGVYLTSY